MVFKLVMTASRTWRRLKGENRLPMVLAGRHLHRRRRRDRGARSPRRLIGPPSPRFGHSSVGLLVLLIAR